MVEWSFSRKGNYSVGNTSLEGKTALVTGGSRGIGKAVSLKLASMGARVVVNYASSQNAAQEVADSICEAGGEAMTLKFDVADSQEVSEGFKQIAARFGSCEVLVNNAGIAMDSLLMRCKDEDWSRIIQTNLGGCFYCARAASKFMMKARFGRIVSISSVIGEMGNAGQSAYSASKSGIFGLTKSLARELGSREITVNAVTPGYIETDMTSGIDDERRQSLLNSIALGRLGSGADVAELVGFLASPQAGYITGQVIGVNGGLYM